MKIVNVNQMQQAERDSSRYGISLAMLMENAGKAVAEETARILSNLQQQYILIMVGPGNNGGDGLVAARHLYDWGTGRVKVYLCGKRPEDDPHLEEIKARGIHYQAMDADNNLNKLNEWLSESTAVLDAIFGTGKSRPISGTFIQTLNSINETKMRHPHLSIIALDLPSGMDADTGSIDPVTPMADNTITLGFPKIGLFNLHGSEHAGNLSIVDIGIPSQLVERIDCELMTDDLIKTILPKRPLISHKGSFGKIMAIAGSVNYIGAAYLACTGTIRVGAGLTTLAIGRSLQTVMATKLTEVTFLPLPESGSNISTIEAIQLLSSHLPQYNVLLMGCGIGQNQATTDLIKSLLMNQQIKLPLPVIDADGINILSKFPTWTQHLKDQAILTPHTGELSRLLNKTIEEIQNNRIGIALEAATKFNKIIVLKGAYTVIASPEGKVRVSPFANPGLASAGTGDVLAGAIAGIAAQGVSPMDAASCGVYLHGLAGEIVREKLGDTGMLASDLLPVLPLAIRQLKHN
jgi:NAD(P)H-hydrate epimerase